MYIYCFCWSDTPEEPDERADQYHVSVDWVLESAQYNEWLNEEDFELLENGKIKVRNCRYCWGVETRHVICNYTRHTYF